MSTKKQVVKRPPLLKASPQPRKVSLEVMGLAYSAVALGDVMGQRSGDAGSVEAHSVKGEASF